MTLPIVLAFGGNALLPSVKKPEEQEAKAQALAQALLLIMPKKAGMVLLHGNGPQVGMILLRIEVTKDRIPAETLDVLVAETQGSIGYLLSRALLNAMKDVGLKIEVATVMTQVLVDPKDPEFQSPSKPVGPFYSECEARLFQKNGWQMAKVKGKGWRRQVPSPRPKSVIESHTIKGAVDHGHIVIAGGGGGIPVIKNLKGHLEGIEAVIDKDRTAALMAVSLNAEILVILTDVPHVAKNFGTPEERPIAEMDVAAAQQLLKSGQFPRGTMGPKVEAAVHYVSCLNRAALITDVDHLKDALQKKAGTWVVP